ncbi:MAG: hypothetical protein BWY76_01750 [bacterium ADurb.Bin429]|nr:MAG: hypothetical protein BWY76_01750 [bacterium ADurb.Bin429]
MHAVGDEVHAGARISEDSLHRSHRTRAGLSLRRHVEDIVKVGGVNRSGVNGRRRLLNIGAGVGDKGYDAAFAQALDHRQDIRRVRTDGHDGQPPVTGGQQVVEQRRVARQRGAPRPRQRHEGAFQVQSRHARARQMRQRRRYRRQFLEECRLDLARYQRGEYAGGAEGGQPCRRRAQSVGAILEHLQPDAMDVQVNEPRREQPPAAVNALDTLFCLHARQSGRTAGNHPIMHQHRAGHDRLPGQHQLHVFDDEGWHSIEPASFHSSTVFAARLILLPYITFTTP